METNSTRPRTSHDPTDRDPLDLIAEEFAARCRLGEKPTVEEYLERYPECAEELRVLLPTVGFLERGRSERARPKSGEFPAFGRLGEFRILREVGRGGMGIVYEAVQESLGRRVAVKVLPRPLASDERARERFLREARAIARLEHPNIVTIHGVSEADGVHFYVMELIDGLGLDQPRVHPKDPGERSKWVADLGCQAAEALAAAHREGILHRDVKPANLILGKDGKLRLADFGLAKLADDLTLTETGGMPGTLRYLAPECLDADGDERSDLYSLGLTLYEVLLGRPAFGESNRIRLLEQVREAVPPAPRSIVPEIPRDLETILLKAMAREPEKRYATAEDLADDLRRFLEDRPIRARRVGPIDRLRSAIRRNPVVALLSTAVVLLAYTAIYFFGLYLAAPPDGRPGAADRKTAKAAGKEQGPEEAPPDDDRKEDDRRPEGRGDGPPFRKGDGPPWNRRGFGREGMPKEAFGVEGPRGPRGRGFDGDAPFDDPRRFEGRGPFPRGPRPEPGDLGPGDEPRHAPPPRDFRPEAPPAPRRPLPPPEFERVGPRAPASP
ncbi:MAG: serine/threonine-protein kinase [Isosphaeraceae bacterium]|nr:serine/threonine-protein kinase [Isosphaeraceae bacterium]